MKKIGQITLKWLKNNNNFDENAENKGEENLDKIDWVRTAPFWLINLGCLLVFYVGFSWVAFITALVLYFSRIFFIGAFLHRYFSHKTYQTSRFWQFIFALMAGTCVQRGPLWWAAHHRQHHMCSDEPDDAHSPVHHGFWWSHMGWFMSNRHYHYNPERVKDLSRYPELVYLDRNDALIPIGLFVSLFVAGTLLHIFAPALQTTGLQMVVWGFCISTVALFHTTVTINSVSHVIGKKRFNTKDNSRNNFLLALITLGEGWHNNHHHYPATARQGFFWWEIDVTYYLLKLMEKLGIIWDVRGVPKSVLQRDLVN